MANYLIKGLTIEQKELLKEHSIGLIEFDISTGSFLIDVEQCKLALKVLDSRIETKQNSGYEDITVITLRKRGQWLISGLDYLAEKLRNQVEKAINETVIQTRQTDVHFHFMNGENMTPVEDGRFHIYVWSSLRSQHDTTVPKAIWGHKTSPADWAFLPLNDGYTISDGAYAVAEFYEDDHLYIHHNIFIEGNKHERAVFQRILEEAMSFYSLPKEEKLRYLASRKNSERETSRSNYIASVSARIANLAANESGYVSSTRKEVPPLIETLVRASRHEIQSNDPKSMQALEAEFKSLLELEKVARVQVSGTSVIIFTDMLSARNPTSGDVHDIGEFLIQLDLTGKNEAVRWYNRTCRVDGVRSNMNAPKVYSDGTACATDLKEIFASLIAGFELAPVAQMAIEFIESCDFENELDKRITAWPVQQPRQGEKRST